MWNSPSLWSCRFSFFKAFLCFLCFLRPFGTLAALKEETAVSVRKARKHTDCRKQQQKTHTFNTKTKLQNMCEPERTDGGVRMAEIPTSYISWHNQSELWDNVCLLTKGKRLINGAIWPKEPNKEWFKFKSLNIWSFFFLTGLLLDWRAVKCSLTFWCQHTPTHVCDADLCVCVR